MLFRKDIEPRCEYCRHGTDLGEGEIGCMKRGITSPGAHCPRFTYDPVKREPERRMLAVPTNFTPEDFEL